jgi:hypothetical protein
MPSPSGSSCIGQDLVLWIPKQSGKLRRYRRWQIFQCAGGFMLQVLSWIIAVSLLAQIAQCDAILAISNSFGRHNQFEFGTQLSPTTRLLTAVLESESFAPANFDQHQKALRFLLLSPLRSDSRTYGWFRGQHRNDLSGRLWRLLRSVIGVNSGPCAEAWRLECEHSFGNPAYRPSPNK